MSKWISGKELLERLKIKDFELFNDYVSKGLQPHNQVGQPISPTDVMEKVTNIDLLKKEMVRMREFREEGEEHMDRNEAGLFYEKAIEPLKKHLMQSEKRLSTVRDLDWNEIEPPASETEAKEIITELVNSLFKMEDVEEFEKQFGIKGKADKPPEPVSSPRKLRPDQIHRIECRKVAKRLWQENPTITIADMILKDEINVLFSGKTYTENTIRNWIKDLCPDRSAGRRPKKPTE